MDGVDEFRDGETLLGYLIHAAFVPPKTEFLSSPEAILQAGLVAVPSGSGIQPHVHLMTERTIAGSSEVLFIRQGRCTVNVYTEDQVLVASRELSAGDAVILIGGGHGLQASEDTVFLEVKTGPYLGSDDTVRF